MLVLWLWMIVLRTLSWVPWSSHRIDHRQSNRCLTLTIWSCRLSGGWSMRRRWKPGSDGRSLTCPPPPYTHSSRFATVSPTTPPSSCSTWTRVTAAFTRWQVRRLAAALVSARANWKFEIIYRPTCVAYIDYSSSQSTHDIDLLILYSYILLLA